MYVHDDVEADSHHLMQYALKHSMQHCTETNCSVHFWEAVQDVWLSYFIWPNDTFREADL